MQPKPRGRPCTPLDPDASKAARLDCDVQALRRERGLSQVALGKLIGCSGQHVSDIERAKACVALSCIAAIDDALGANGALLALQPAVAAERETARQARVAARRGEAQLLAALRYAVLHSDAGDDDVDPTTRLELLEAGAATALGVPALGEASARAGEVDPELPEHLAALLNLVGRHYQMFGPRDVLDIVRRELRLIAGYRAAARGELRTKLMRIEACWCESGAWLAHDCGDRRERDALLSRVLDLACEADYPDMLAWARARQAQWADAPLAIRLAEAGLRTPRAGAHTRALCTVRAAYAHARIGDAESTTSSIADAEALLARDSPPPPASAISSADRLVRCWEARCWSALKPATGVALYEDVLRDWPRHQVTSDGLYRARLARAYVDAGELDRAKAEGARAFAVYKQTRSATAARELRQLGAVLRAA